MTDLTEQWKKGELPNGHYYVKDGENIIAELLDGYFYNDGQPMTSFSGGVDEVLAKVPNYEEYLSLTYAKEEDEGIIAEYEAENIKLKELLKECKGSIATLLSKRITEVNGIKQKELLAKINQALGEDK